VTGEPLISVRELIRIYKMGEETVTALGGVSVDVAEGEFVAVMGPSGSGKSTFMNIVGCLDRPDGGTYRLAGEEVSSLSPDALAGVRSRRIGFVFQQFNLLERTDALGNVMLPMLYASSDRRERRRRAEVALARVGLADRMGHTPLQLSGGQQQRVAIARALVNTPSILLADEPTGALDSRTSLDIMALFQQLNREGMTVLVVTHEQDVADFAGRVVRFRDGKVLSDRKQQPKQAAEALAALDRTLAEAAV
jgi:putative ABC transport system ATP-binding protein